MMELSVIFFFISELSINTHQLKKTCRDEK